MVSLAKVSRLYEIVDHESKIIRCDICERRCVLRPGSKGICGNYVNINGELINIGYGRLSAIESRPIEIKPLFHYWPNSTALTFSNWGCNFYCPWCQNHHLSFRHPSTEDPYISPEKLVSLAERNGDEGFSASFNEPTTQLDYVLDLAELAKKKNLYVMLVTNGYMTEKALELLVEYGVDGFSIDIKGCPSMRVLRNIDHEKVFRNAKKAIDLGAHVEMIYLVVTETNDFEECFEWIINKHLSLLGPKTPLHINRYYPAHRWEKPPTPINKLREIAERAKREGIEYVYIGNINDPDTETTRCPRCGKILIARRFYRVQEFKLDKRGEKYYCPRCGEEIPIRGRYIPHKKYYWWF